jgi:hypothetical protein
VVDFDVLVDVGVDGFMEFNFEPAPLRGHKRKATSSAV